MIGFEGLVDDIQFQKDESITWRTVFHIASLE